MNKWVGTAAGVALGLFDYVVLGALGVRMDLAGRDVTAPVMALYGATFGALGWAIGTLTEARATIRAQLDDLHTARTRVVQAETLASLGRMAAGVAHEVRNPLGVIRGAAGLLSEEGGDAEERARACAFIRDEVDRLDAYVRRILDFSRPLVPARDDVDLVELGERARALAGVEGVTVRGAGRAKADADLVVQVLLGLLRNAGEAARARIEVRVEPGAVEVVDDGPGVPAGVREQLFTPFFTTKAQGTGLGLAMGRRIAEAHGGGLRHVPTEAGACFRLELPR